MEKIMQETLNAKPVRLHVTHSWGGGIERWLQDFCNTDIRYTNMILRSVGGPGAPAHSMALYADRDTGKPIYTWDLTVPIQATSITNTDYRHIIDEITARFEVRTIFISSFIGHSLDILNTAIDTKIICHDYYPFCPAIIMFFDGICEECEFSNLQRCYRGNKANRLFPGSSASEWVLLRKNYLSLIRNNHITLIAPSASVKYNLSRLASSFSEFDFRIIPHGYNVNVLKHPIEPDLQGDGKRKMRILILGKLYYYKGLEIFKSIYRDILDVAEFYLLGCGNDGQAFIGIEGIHIVAENYEPSDLLPLTQEIAPDLGLLLSICPETYSYTLSELMTMNIPVLATRVGSFGDRITDGVNGFLSEPLQDALIQKIRTLYGQPHLLTTVANNLKSMKHRGTREMVEEYPGENVPNNTGQTKEINLLNMLEAELERTHWALLNTEKRAEEAAKGAEEAAREAAKEAEAAISGMKACLEETGHRLNDMMSRSEQAESRLSQVTFQLAQAETTIENMKASKFWKLRMFWFKVKSLRKVFAFNHTS